ncbi:carbonic anhydrase [Piscinibacterium candidicorallinum]|uniref:carbonic anhydrase n=1 Tax=Piscinibacterium candidicorallinum TaxID=1793872 RepID=A0ABV7H945_9BURK
MQERDLIDKLERFETGWFPQHAESFKAMVRDGQHPSTLFIGCSDSRVVPYVLMDCGPGELFIVRNVGNLVPPWDSTGDAHGTAAAIEFATAVLEVNHIVVCGHSHCGAMRALYEEPPACCKHLRGWLSHAYDARLPVAASAEALRRVEQRNIVLQLSSLMSYPMVEARIASGSLFLHGWHYLLDEGVVLVFDPATREFRPRGDYSFSGSTAAVMRAESDAQRWCMQPHDRSV